MWYCIPPSKQQIFCRKVVSPCNFQWIWLRLFILKDTDPKIMLQLFFSIVDQMWDRILLAHKIYIFEYIFQFSYYLKLSKTITGYVIGVLFHLPYRVIVPSVCPRGFLATHLYLPKSWSCRHCKQIIILAL